VSAALVADIVLLALVAVTATAAIGSRSLLAASMLLGIYSFLVASVWVDLHAPDVAFTEAAVGAGVSTVLMLAALYRTGWREKPAPLLHVPALIGALAAGAALAAGIGDLPRFGDPASVPATGVAAWYLANAVEQTHVPNVVTAVLASYRGYDTMFETAVIFTGGTAVLLLLRSGLPKPGEEERS
jgi:multicomponent Na+:H+ antiporter subunit B